MITSSEAAACYLAKARLSMLRNHGWDGSRASSFTARRAAWLLVYFPVTQER